jgi:hypothetical protein
MSSRAPDTLRPPPTSRGARHGAALLRCASGPITYAAGLFMQNKVPEGLGELARASLEAGLGRGVTEVATRVGVSERDVWSLLPEGEVQALLTSLDAKQQRAMAAWMQFGGHLGRLLDGVGQLTVDARVPEASVCLRRIADKLSRDAHLAEPLRALSDEVASWEELVDKMRHALDDGRELARAHLRQRLRRGAVGLALGCVVAIGGALGVRVVTARARVDRALAVTDPCAGHADPSDLARASDAQRKKVGELERACAALRLAEEQEKREREERERREREEKQKRDELDKACAGLAERIDKGSLDERDKALFGDAAAFGERLAKGELAPADLGVSHAWPCPGRAAESKVKARFEARVVGTSTWFDAPALSPEVRALLAKKRDELPERQRGLYAFGAEQRAKAAVLKGVPAELDAAFSRCELARELEGAYRGGCATLAGLRAKKGP